jgi:hypothetical protein
MVDLGARLQRRGFCLDEIADPNALAERGAGAQAGIGADGGASADRGLPIRENEWITAPSAMVTPNYGDSALNLPLAKCN